MKHLRKRYFKSPTKVKYNTFFKVIWMIDALLVGMILGALI